MTHPAPLRLTPCTREARRSAGGSASTSRSRSGSTSSAAAFSRALSSLHESRGDFKFAAAVRWLKLAMRCYWFGLQQLRVPAHARARLPLHNPLQNSSRVESRLPPQVCSVYNWAPVHVQEAELAQRLLPHLQQVRQPQLPVRLRLRLQPGDVRPKCPGKGRRSPTGICLRAGSLMLKQDCVYSWMFS